MAIELKTTLKFSVSIGAFLTTRKSPCRLLRERYSAAMGYFHPIKTVFFKTLLLFLTCSRKAFSSSPLFSSIILYDISWGNFPISFSRKLRLRRWRQLQNCIANIMNKHTGQVCYFCKAPEGVKLSFVLCPLSITLWCLLQVISHTLATDGACWL